MPTIVHEPSARRSLDDHGQQIRDAAASVDAATLRLRAAVSAARRDGVSWAAIGEVLGVSRQASWERFHRHVDEG